MFEVKKGLFINNKKARDSIYESGHMVYQCLRQSGKYKLDYQEVDINDRTIKKGYDFYFFNYHPFTMKWLQTRHLKKELGFVITMILEVAPNDPFVMCPENDFDFYCALDPTVKSRQNNVYPFPRPLEKINFDLPVIQNQIPLIGTFGFATKGKGFHHVVEAVNKEFTEAIVRINIPFGDFVPESKQYASYLGNLCRQKAKPGIEVRVTHDFMSKEELIKWCNANTLNCFLYDRNMPGLSATTDQAIVAGKPMAVSANDTFRHITSYLPPYPLYSLRDSIEKSLPMVKKMENDWQPERFTERFEEVLKVYGSQMTVQPVNTVEYILPLKTNSVADIIEHRLKKYKRKLKKISLRNFFHSKNNNEII